MLCARERFQSVAVVARRRPTESGRNISIICYYSSCTIAHEYVSVCAVYKYTAARCVWCESSDVAVVVIIVVGQSLTKPDARRRSRVRA